MSSWTVCRPIKVKDSFQPLGDATKPGVFRAGGLPETLRKVDPIPLQLQ